MKRNKKILHIILAVFIAINELFFYAPLNADVTETETVKVNESTSVRVSESAKGSVKASRKESQTETETKKVTETTAASETTSETSTERSAAKSSENSSETSSEASSEISSESSTGTSSETSNESKENKKITSVRNGKEFVKGVSKLPRRYRIAASSKKGKLKINGAEGVDYGGSCILSFNSKAEYEAALKELENKDIGYSKDGSVRVCSPYSITAGKDVKINPNAKTKIAVIDTGSNIANEKISLLGDDGSDANGHGTSMASLILSKTNDAYIISIKAIGDNGRGNLSDVYAAVRYAADHEAEYILMAISIKNNGEFDEFISLVEECIKKGICVIASAGNNNTDASKYLPAGIKGVTTIGAIDTDGYKTDVSNYGKKVDYYVVAGSTSEASAIYAGLKIADKASSCSTEYKVIGNEGSAVDENENDNEEDTEDNEFTINKSKMTWPTKKELQAVGYFRSSDFGNAVIAACKAMKGVDYGTGNGKADCMRYVNLAYAQALHLISGLKVSNGKISGLKRSKGNVTYNGISLTNSKYHLVDGCTTWSEKSPHNIGHPGGINIKDNGGLAASIKKLGAKKGSILLFGGYKNDKFRWTHAAIYAGSGKTVYDAPGGSQTAGVPYSKSESGSGSKTYTHVAALNYATFTQATTLSVKKTSANPAVTLDNDCYSITHTIYGLYDSSNNLLYEFGINENGESNTYVITDYDKKYYIKEIIAGRGFILDEKKYDLDISAPPPDGKLTVEVQDVPIGLSGSLIIEKKDDKAWNRITGSKMSDAQFRVDYYDTYAIDSYKDLTESSGQTLKPKASATVSGTENSNGTAKIEISTKTLVAADASGYFSKLKGLNNLPLGTYVITETKAPDGYKAADKTKPLIMRIYQEENNAVAYYSADPTIYQVLENKIVLNEASKTGKGSFKKKITPKEDDEADLSLYSPEGTTYNIYYKSNKRLALSIVFDKNGNVSEAKYTDGVKGEISGDTITLPAGEYYAKEIHSGYGLYLDTSEKPFSITEGKTAAIEFKDEPVFTRFDCLLKKIKNDNLSNEVRSLIPVEGAEFEISYYAGFYEGESYKQQKAARKWTFKTDNDGKLSYDIDHLVKGDSLFVNGTGEYIVPQGTFVLAETKAPPGTTKSNDVRVITVRFAKDIIKGSENDPASSKASVSTMFNKALKDIKDGVINYYNVYETSISTLAVSTANGSKEIAAASGVSITDTLSYKNLIPGYQYKISAWVVRSDGSTVLKPSDTVLQINNEEERTGTLKIPLVIDASGLQGEILTVMENVYIVDKNGKELLYLKHDDINDTNQQIKVPFVKTELIDEKIDEFNGKANTKQISYGKDVSITDFISYKNLITGKKYKITGTLMVKDTGKPFVDSKGKPYTASVEFTAEKPDGVVKVLFEHIDTTVLSGSIVCFEKLSSEGIDLVTHYDINDDDQTLIDTKIKTSASDKTNKTKTLTYSEKVDIKDTVSYKGLKPGIKYLITGTLMDRSTGKPYKDPDGKNYINTVEFTPKKSDGTVDVIFEKVKVSYEYTEIVVFEKLMDLKTKTVLAVHEDINDKDQTVYRPVASTVASSANGSKTIAEGTGKVRLSDKVLYKGFTTGNTYSAVATLYKTNGTQIMNNGVPVTNTVTFSPVNSDGTIDVPLTFDLSLIKPGESVVIFENIYDVATKEEIAGGKQKKDIEIVRHNDLNNKDQTLNYKNKKHKIPKTGEETSPAMVIGLLVLCSAAGPMGLAFRLKRGAKVRAPRQSRRKPSLNSLLCSLRHRKPDGSSRVWKNWSP